MMKSRVLITGINGFIGSNLEEYIKEKYPSWQIYGIDKKGNKPSRFFELDIKNKKELKSILCQIKPVYIYHLAGNVAAKDFKELLLSNVFDTFVLLETIKEIKNYNPRIIIPSSASEYGRVCSTEMPIREDLTLNPLSLYGFSKMMQTNLSLLFVEKGLDIVIARIFNITGKGTPIDFSIGKFAYELALIKKKKKRPIIYTKNLYTERDFLDIRDVGKYLVAVALCGNRGEVYNICRGKSYSIRYLLNRLIKISGIKNIKIIKDKEYDKESNVADSFGSTKKLKKITKRIEFIPIDKSLEDTYFYYLTRV